jgi:two-component system chemotaxis response regulator CheB
MPHIAPTTIRIIAIGASTGGPPVLQTILSELSKNLPVPILIVQHIAKGFIKGLAEWLGQVTGFPVHIAAHRERLAAGHVYFAPDDIHMGVESNDRIVLTKSEPNNGLRPSASHLFRSVAKAYRESAVGVLLTGMGADGAAELKLMKDNGGITIAQDKASSLVHGMPGVAIQLGAATYVLSPPEIVKTLERLIRKN